MQKKSAGRNVGIVALVLLVILTAHAMDSNEAVTARFIVAGMVDLMLFHIAVRLLGDAHAIDEIQESSSGHVQGVRQTVDRLASVLKDAPR